MQSVQETADAVMAYLPNLMGAFAILVVGWLAALMLGAVVRKALSKTTLDNRVAQWLVGDERGSKMPVEHVAGRITFYTVMLFVLVAFFQAVGLTLMTQPLTELLNQVFAFAPRLLGAFALLGLAWALASALRMVVRGVLSRARLDERIAEGTGATSDAPVPIGQTIGEVVYWLVFLFFLPAVLGTLALQGLLEPVQSMVNEILRYAPNVLTAGLILVMGWFVARIVQRILTNLLAAMGVDRIGTSVGMDRALGPRSLSDVIGTVAYVLVLLPVIIASLNALDIAAVTAPASNMLDTILGAVPMLFGAMLVLSVAFLVGKVVAGLVTTLLANIGFDRVLGALGIHADVGDGRRSPSAIAGTVVLIGILLFAAIEAANLLGFDRVAEMFVQLTQFGAHLLVALAVVAFGLFFANLAARGIAASTIPNARFLALGARTAILILAGAMGLRELGVANEIITLAFGLSLGAVAVAAAVAFGLGGRELAAKQLAAWHEAIAKPPS